MGGLLFASRVMPSGAGMCRVEERARSYRRERRQWRASVLIGRRTYAASPRRRGAFQGDAHCICGQMPCQARRPTNPVEMGDSRLWYNLTSRARQRAGPSTRLQGHDHHENDYGEYDQPQDHSRGDSHRQVSRVMSLLNKRTESGSVLFTLDSNMGSGNRAVAGGNV